MSANWRPVFSGESYFDQFSVPSPLRHTWSLAIEEQWYAFWPLLLFVVLRLRGGSLRVTLAVAMAMAAGSALLMGLALPADARPVTRLLRHRHTRAIAISGRHACDAHVAVRAGAKCRSEGDFAGRGCPLRRIHRLRVGARRRQQHSPLSRRLPGPGDVSGRGHRRLSAAGRERRRSGAVAAAVAGPWPHLIRRLPVALAALSHADAGPHRAGTTTRCSPCASSPRWRSPSHRTGSSRYLCDAALSSDGRLPGRLRRRPRDASQSRSSL